jgi:hypothetical protein
VNGMRVAYLHYLYGEDTALHHVRQFAAAARRLGAQVDVHAMNLAPPDAGDAGGGGTRSARLRRALKRRWGGTRATCAARPRCCAPPAPTWCWCATTR